MNSRRRSVCTAFAFVALSNSVFAYGPTGHEIVGGVADELIAGTPVAEKVARLIDGMTLERASTIADEIKGWESIIQSHFTTQAIAISTDSCAIFGERMHPVPMPLRQRLLITGSITLMCQ